jgi:RHS repeat-associated protein
VSGRVFTLERDDEMYGDENILVPDNYTITQLTVKETQYIAVPDVFKLSNLSVTATPYPDVAYIHQLNVSYAKPYTRPLCANNNDKLEGVNKYRFGFNGKENNNEILGNGRWQDYGERDFRPDLGRFIKVDPLTKKYPELSTYQFASNTPIQAIDQDGLEAFIVHGTTQTQTGVNFTSEAVTQFKRIGGNTVSDDKFRWNAPINNDYNIRKVAAQQLVKHIIETRAKMMANGEITENESITLVGYSHGGNVSIQAAQMLNDKFGIKVNLITVGTPAKNSAFGTDADNPVFGNPEDPQGNTGINSHYHIRHVNDMVWKVADAAGDKSDPYYSNEGTTRNWDIPNTEIKLDGPIKAHTDLPSHPKFETALKQLPEMPAAPAAGKPEVKK